MLGIHRLFAKVEFLPPYPLGHFMRRVLHVAIRTIPQIPLHACVCALGPQCLPPGDLLKVEKVHPVIASGTDDFFWAIRAEKNRGTLWCDEELVASDLCVRLADPLLNELVDSKIPLVRFHPLSAFLPFFLLARE